MSRMTARGMARRFDSRCAHRTPTILNRHVLRTSASIKRRDFGVWGLESGVEGLRLGFGVWGVGFPVNYEILSAALNPAKREIESSLLTTYRSESTLPSR